MKQTDVQRIMHMKRYCESVARSIARFGNSYEAFDADDDYFNAVSMCIYQIGELSIGLTDEFKAQTAAQMEWHKVRGMRNAFAHRYNSMDKITIWQTATESIPALLAFCNQTISENKEAFTPPPRPKDL